MTMKKHRNNYLRITTMVIGSALATSAVAAKIQTDPKTFSNPINIQMAPVLDTGNSPDPVTLFGNVNHAYTIATLDITIGQYVTFLNAVAKNDAHGLYNEKMSSDLLVAGIARSGRPGHYQYSAIGPSGSFQISSATPNDRPITYVSWFDAARFANWMSNGQPSGSQSRRTTEDGAYNLTSLSAKKGLAITKNGINPNTNSAPSYFIPSENEWYKAAYFNPTLNNGTGGYNLYATQSNTAPGNIPGIGINDANYAYRGAFSITQLLSIDFNQNYLTDVGSFINTRGPYGAYDQNGSVWEWNDMDGSTTPVRIIRGGGWTSFYTYLQSSYRLGNIAQSSNNNLGFRLTSSVNPSNSADYELVKVGNPRNHKDPTTGFGKVDKTFWIGKYEVTIAQWCKFLNAIAKVEDKYFLFDSQMTSALNSAGIQKTGELGNYTYTPIDNAGDSSNRPVTYVSWFDIARYANWMANGEPNGIQSEMTTENGTYPLNGVTSGTAITRNTINPNTGLPPSFAIPTENEWYKAAYYEPKLNNGNGGYYKYATTSNIAPGNQVGDMKNMANYIDDYSRTFFYCVPQSRLIDPEQNYLVDAGAFSGTKSYYGILDLAASVYQWNDLDGSNSLLRGVRGGFWFAGPVAMQSLNFANVSPNREENDTGIRLAGPG